MILAIDRGAGLRDLMSLKGAAASRTVWAFAAKQFAISSKTLLNK